MRTLLLLATILAASHAADKPNIAADWKGTLKTPGSELRLVLHIQKMAEGQFKAILDSVDQGANGIPVAAVTLEGSRVKLDVAAIKGSYNGQVSEDAKTLTGTWSQGGWDGPLTFTRADAVNAPEAQDQSATVTPLLGVWEGTLDTGAMKLRVRFTVRRDDNGQISGVFDSIDQGANACR